MDLSHDETKNILKSIVISSPSKMTMDNLNKDYKKIMGCDIPFRKFGFRTIEDFFRSISDAVLITYGRNPLVYAAPSEKTQHIEQYKSIKNYVNREKTILSNQKINNIPQRLQLKAGLNGNMENSHTIPTTTEDVLQEVVRNNAYSIKIDNVKCNKETPKSGKSDTNEVNKILALPRDEAVPDIKKNDVMFLIHFPKNTVKFGYKIDSFELPKNLKIGDKINLFVTEIHNPYKFWFHIAKQNDELDQLMEGLEDFYSNLEQELIMDISNIVPGQICAAPYTGLWNRAEILGIPKNGKVKVCFIDYGTVSDVTIDKVKYLPVEFAKLNKQAFRGCLSHIKPAKSRWSRDSTYAFLDLVTDKCLCGKITDILSEEKVVRFILTDANRDEDFQINEALIFKGHAKMNNSIMLRNIFSYPTFEMLEKGEYLSFHEIGILLAKGIDYETKVYNNIICDVYANQCSLPEYLKMLTTFHIKRSD